MMARRLTALTDGVAIQVLTGAPNMTVSAMKEILVQFVQDELIAGRKQHRPVSRFPPVPASAGGVVRSSVLVWI